MLIHKNAVAHVHDVAHGLLCVCRAFSNTGYGSWAPSDFFNDADLPLCSIQGNLPQVYCMDQGQGHNHPLPSGWPYDRAGFTGHGGRDYGRPPLCDWKSPNNGHDSGRPSPHDWSIHPYQNRHGFLPNVQCDACKRIGHVITNCDMLAMVLFLDKYVRQSLSDEEKRKVELAWLCMCYFLF
jgi:hypothetical protein